MALFKGCLERNSNFQKRRKERNNNFSKIVQERNSILMDAQNVIATFENCTGT